MKHLKLFQTEADYNAFIQSEDFITPNVSYAVDTDTVFYHIVKTGTMYTVYLVEWSDISGITYNEVDLGLPSGLKWADKNIGSDTEDDYGCYFAWGDTVGYKYKGIQQVSAAELATLIQPVLFPDPSADDYVELTEDNISDILTEQGADGTDLTTIGVLIKNRSYTWSNYFDTTDGGLTFNKYTTDKLTVLEATDDAATVNMSTDWRMPTYDELTELINNTTVTFIDLDGNEYSQSDVQNDAITSSSILKGIKLTGSNGNSIFIPAAGGSDYVILGGVRGDGHLWARSCTENPQNANCLFFSYDGRLQTADAPRCYGLTIRGVHN